ncbi:MAG: galactitol-1-phosphate 5-dehydrogenase [Kiritimatiellae bacterium]|nr:galactitol-1-phosphate 5-dehydrogenase [Kiritimatiellia bacterium]MDD5522936.1 galactitol-1-phosphate 5-dehydrogenase [Kiritimatiellia bacterium]
MKALVLKEYNHFVIEDVPAPVPADDEVLVEVKACGICGSDVHGMDGSTGRRKPPIIMGHEAAGVIAETGHAVQGWKKGERITFDSTIYCGQCWHCKRGEINLCDNRRVLGVSCDEYRQHGAFARYVVVPQRILYRLPETLRFEQAAMVEALSIAVHAVNRTPRKDADSAVVVGVGMIGLLVVQVLRSVGCGIIVAVDIDQKKLDLACKHGADIGVKPDTDFVQTIIRKTGGRGCDHAFEVVGMSQTILTAVQSLRKGGSLTLVGNLSPKVEMPLQTIVTREISIFGSCASCGEYPACLDLIASGRVDVDMMISKIAPLTEGAEWFARLYRKEAGLMKVILTP